LLPNTILFADNGDKLSILSISVLSNLQQIYETFLITLDQYFNDNEVGQLLRDSSLLCKKRIIKIVSILMRSTIYYLLNDNAVHTTSNIVNDGVTWIDEFQRQLDSQNSGYLLSDTTRFYKRTVWQLLSLLTNDEVQTQYMLKTLSAPNGLLNNFQNDIVKIKGTSNDSKDEFVQNSNSYHETLDTLVEFFPDYGKGFLLAVLSTFDFNVDNTVEAIFTDNLPTKLAMMDRKTSLIKKGKEDKHAHENSEREIWDRKSINRRPKGRATDT
jgi:Cft2 family RNA processing exonuclease